MAKSKFFEVRCKTCDKLVKAEFKAVYELDGTKNWYKCPKCKQTMLAVPFQANSIMDNRVEGDGVEVIEYSPITTFRLGDEIYHKGFDSRGVVTGKEVTTSGLSTIVVEFDKLGMRKLVESVKN